MATYYTSDTHFGHHNIIEYCNRPYANVREMNLEMERIWNETVSPTDTVYHLGDFALGDLDNALEILRRLNGCKILVSGNHDPKKVRESEHWAEVHTYLRIGRNVMFHFPIEQWNNMDSQKTIHLHGHCHGTIPRGRQPKNRYDVGWDSLHRPMTIEEIKEQE